MTLILKSTPAASRRVGVVFCLSRRLHSLGALFGTKTNIERI
jgi:hypothetical protein